MPPRAFPPEGEISRRHPSSLRVYIETYLQLKYAVCTPEKIRDHMEWLSIDDVSALNARKYKMVTLGERKTENAQVDYEYCGIIVRELTVNPKPCIWT